MRPLTLNTERGSALVLALWAMMAMAMLVACVRILALRTASLAEARLERAQLTALADGMINLSVLRVMDIAGGHPPVDGTETPLGFGGLTGQVRVQDESGKIDINHASQNLLAALFVSKGLDIDAAQGLADKILDWREPGVTRRLNGAKANDYRNAGYAYAPRGGKFATVDEVRLVMGMTTPLFDRFEPLLTVVSQNAYPESAVAPDGVLRALNMDDARIAAIQAARASRLRTQEDGTVADLEPPDSAGHAFNISVTLRGRTESVGRSATVRLTGIPQAPLVIYQWQ